MLLIFLDLEGAMVSLVSESQNSFRGFLVVYASYLFLYLLTHHSGIGSWERTESEDMLLSLFSAAVSDLAMFKTHFTFDRYTNQTLKRFNMGAPKVRMTLFHHSQSTYFFPPPLLFSSLMYRLHKYKSMKRLMSAVKLTNYPRALGPLLLGTGHVWLKLQPGLSRGHHVCLEGLPILCGGGDNC